MTIAITTVSCHMEKRKPMEAFAVLGAHPQLSVAEWAARAGESSVIAFTNTVALLSVDPTQTQETLAVLGGTQKVGCVLFSMGKRPSTDDLASLLAEHIRKRDRGTGRCVFGISDYMKGAAEARRTGLTVKNLLKKAGIAARVVTSREASLSSVVVRTNKLLERGGEYILAHVEGQFIVGETLAVQDYEQYARRDFGRPERDAREGMLPPKLAQIMINLASPKADTVLVDPFCGSGTVLQEAALMGIRHLMGSDSSSDAVTRTQKNLAWLDADVQTTITQVDVRNLQETVAKNTADCIVTEPDLGPPLRSVTESHVIRIRRSLEALYADAFNAFAHALKPSGTIVMVWPFWMLGKNPFRIDGWSALSKTGFVPRLIHAGGKVMNPGPRYSFDYRRTNQRVGREIVLATASSTGK